MSGFPCASRPREHPSRVFLGTHTRLPGRFHRLGQLLYFQAQREPLQIRTLLVLKMIMDVPTRFPSSALLLFFFLWRGGGGFPY